MKVCPICGVENEEGANDIIVCKGCKYGISNNGGRE